MVCEQPLEAVEHRVDALAGGRAEGDDLPRGERGPDVLERVAHVGEVHLADRHQHRAVGQLRIEAAQLVHQHLEVARRVALGLRVAGRLEEALEILQAQIEAFGRRRSPERAAVHYQLAQVAHAGGDLEQAMSELESARKMDMSHPGILRMAGQMAREAGQREKAEKSYGAPDVQVGASEVLYELSLLARDNEDEAQAKELLETALSTAAQHDAEAERLEKDLLARGEVELALTTIE